MTPQQLRRYLPGLLLLFVLGLFAANPVGEAAAGPARAAVVAVLPAGGGVVAVTVTDRHGPARIAEHRRSWPMLSVLAVSGDGALPTPRALRSYAVAAAPAPDGVRAPGGPRPRAPPAG